MTWHGTPFHCRVQPIMALPPVQYVNTAWHIMVSHCIVSTAWYAMAQNPIRKIGTAYHCISWHAPWTAGGQLAYLLPALLRCGSWVQPVMFVCHTGRKHIDLLYDARWNQGASTSKHIAVYGVYRHSKAYLMHTFNRSTWVWLHQCVQDLQVAARSNVNQLNAKSVQICIWHLQELLTLAVCACAQ